MAEFIYNNIFNIAILIVICWFFYIFVKGLVKLMVFFIIIFPLEVFITLFKIFHILKHDPIKESSWYKKWYGQKNQYGVDYSAIDRDGYEEKKSPYREILEVQFVEQLFHEE